MQRARNMIKQVFAASLLRRVKVLLARGVQVAHVIDGLAHAVYAQQGEDLALVHRLFQNTNSGFYVDVGAYHPLVYSNTYLLHTQGWCGINIEPNPDTITAFRKFRKHDLNINVGISEAHKQLTYYCFNDSAVNTFVEEQACKWAQVSGFRIKSTHEIMTLPLSEVLDQYLPAGQEIDLMSIDVEGMDLEVLRSNNWDRYRPRALLVEETIIGRRYFTDSEVYQFLRDHGFSLWNICGGTWFFLEDAFYNETVAHGGSVQ